MRPNNIQTLYSQIKMRHVRNSRNQQLQIGRITPKFLLVFWRKDSAPLLMWNPLINLICAHIHPFCILKKLPALLFLYISSQFAIFLSIRPPSNRASQSFIWKIIALRHLADHLIPLHWANTISWTFNCYIVQAKSLS